LGEAVTVAACETCLRFPEGDQAQPQDPSSSLSLFHHEVVQRRIANLLVAAF